MSISRSSKLKLFLRLLFLLGVVRLLIVAASATDQNGGGRKILKSDTMENNHKVVMKEKEDRTRRTVSKFDDLNYSSSKRKVPNGPDPIHNRRAGNSHQPPGQS